MKFVCAKPEEVCKEAFWLAWNACGGTTGMGVLQDNPLATRDEIWQLVTGQTCRDYIIPRGETLKPYADYVFGRMMKIGFTVLEDGIEYWKDAVRGDYQAWAYEYPTTTALLEAANCNING